MPDSGIFNIDYLLFKVLILFGLAIVTNPPYVAIWYQIKQFRLNNVPLHLRVRCKLYSGCFDRIFTAFVIIFSCIESISLPGCL